MKYKEHGKYFGGELRLSLARPVCRWNANVLVYNRGSISVDLKQINIHYSIWRKCRFMGHYYNCQNYNFAFGSKWV
jgi:hypothetical protein